MPTVPVPARRSRSSGRRLLSLRRQSDGKQPRCGDVARRDLRLWREVRRRQAQRLHLARRRPTLNARRQNRRQNRRQKSRRRDRTRRHDAARCGEGAAKVRAYAARRRRVSPNGFRLGVDPRSAARMIRARRPSTSTPSTSATNSTLKAGPGLARCLRPRHARPGRRAGGRRSRPRARRRQARAPASVRASGPARRSGRRRRDPRSRSRSPSRTRP